MKKTLNLNKHLKGKTLYLNHRKYLSDLSAQRIPNTTYVFLSGVPHGRNHQYYFVIPDIILETMVKNIGYGYYHSKGVFQLLTK